MIPVKVGFGFLKRVKKLLFVKPKATPNMISPIARFIPNVVSEFQFNFTLSSTSVFIISVLSRNIIFYRIV